jgi:hypothetical protein
MVQLFVVHRIRRMTRRGVARFRFRVRGATGRVHIGIDVLDPRVVLHSRVRMRGTRRGTIVVRPAQRLPLGRHTLTATVTDDAGATARVELTVVVQSCLSLGALQITALADGQLLTLPFSSTCGLGFKCDASATYHHGAHGDEMTLSFGHGPASLHVTIPLGDREFTEADVQISVSGSDGTSASWRLGEDPEITWAPPAPHVSVPVRVAAVAGAVVVALVGGFAIGSALEDGSDHQAQPRHPPASSKVTTTTHGSRPPTSSTIPGSTTTTASTLPRTDGLPVNVSFVDPPQSVAAGAPLTLAIQVEPAPGEPASAELDPTGSVDLVDGTSVIATDALVHGRARLTFSSLALLPHRLVARYDGDDTFTPGPSEELVVTVHSIPTALELTPHVGDGNCPSTGLIATVTEGDIAATGSMWFFDGPDQVLGTAGIDRGTATLPDVTLGNGKHTIEARYAGDALHDESRDAADVNIDCPPAIG